MNHVNDKGREVVDVLLMEDNPGDVDLIRNVIESGHYPVRLTVAADGAEALDCLRRRGRFAETPTARLILMDVNTPRKNAHDVLAEIKGDYHLRRIPVVILSGSTQVEEIDRCYSERANCYVEKALGLHDFNRKIQELLSFWLGVAELPHTGGVE